MFDVFDAFQFKRFGSCRQCLMRNDKMGRLFWSHISLSLRYVGASFCQALATLSVGLPACAVPFALLLNGAGEAMVSHPRSIDQVGRVSLLPMAWSAEDVRILDDGPYYIFFACNSGLVACLFASICTLFVTEWRGRSNLFGWPLTFAAFSIFAISSSNLFRIWLLAEGHVSSSMYQVCTVGVYLVCLVGALCIVLSGEARGARLQLAGYCFIAFAPFVVVHWAMSFLVARYFRSPQFAARMLCLIALQGIRAVGIEATIRASGRIPGCPSQARVLPLWMINMFTLGTLQIMQASSPDLGSTAVVYLLLALSEIGRHKRYLTTGQTEIVAWISMFRRLVVSEWVSESQVHPVEVHTAVVVASGALPAEADIVYEASTPSAADSSDTSKQPSVAACTDEQVGRPSTDDSTDARTQPNAADEHKQLLVDLVVATNLTEILMIITVATVFLIAKFNPAHFVSGPFPLEKTIMTAALALLSELGSDFFVVFLASKKTRNVSELYQITSTASWTQKTPWRNAALCLVAMIIALVSVAYMASHLCPRPLPGTNTLYVIGVCS